MDESEKINSIKSFYETSGAVSYIKNKTAVLIACSFMFGGIVADSDTSNIDLLHKIGLNLGIAFQLEDDLLDCFGAVSYTHLTLPTTPYV